MKNKLFVGFLLGTSALGGTTELFGKAPLRDMNEISTLMPPRVPSKFMGQRPVIKRPQVRPHNIYVQVRAPFKKEILKQLSTAHVHWTL